MAIHAALLLLQAFQVLSLVSRLGAAGPLERCERCSRGRQPGATDRSHDCSNRAVFAWSDFQPVQYAFVRPALARVGAQLALDQLRPAAAGSAARVVVAVPPAASRSVPQDTAPCLAGHTPFCRYAMALCPTRRMSFCTLRLQPHSSYSQPVGLSGYQTNA